MSLIEAVNEACDSVALDRFDVLVGNNNPNALTMIRFAQEAGEEIARRGDWQNMLKTADVSGTPFALPDDFQRLVASGVMLSDGSFARVILNGAQWAVASQAMSGAYVFIQSGEIRFSPASTASGATIQYVSDQWLRDVEDDTSIITADDNEPLFPERLLTGNLIWRWRRAQGLTYDDHLAEFEAALVQELAADRGAFR